MVRSKQVRFDDGEAGARQIATFVQTWNKVAAKQGSGRADVARAMRDDKILGPLVRANGEDNLTESLAKLYSQVKALREAVEASAPEIASKLELNTLTGRGRPAIDRSSLALQTAILLGLEKTANQ